MNSIAMVQSMGYNERQARAALSSTDNNLERSVTSARTSCTHIIITIIIIIICLLKRLSSAEYFYLNLFTDFSYSIPLPSPPSNITSIYSIHPCSYLYVHPYSYPCPYHHIMHACRALDWIFSRDDLDQAVDEVSESYSPLYLMYLMHSVHLTYS